jgi:hypothetical protein
MVMLTKRAHNAKAQDLMLAGAKLVIHKVSFLPNAHHAMEKASNLG